MNYWLIKFAPFRTSWEEILARGIFTLRGVRSYQARKNLQAMRKKDHVLFYQSQQNQSIRGLLQVTKEFYPDPTSADLQWVTCDFATLQNFQNPISLATLKSDPALVTLPLLRQPRLSVMPVTPIHFQQILTYKEQKSVK